MHLPQTKATQVIQNRGFRLSATCLLPISKDTIVYGSSDAGVSVQNSDPLVSSDMKKLGQTLNLREHMVFGQLLYVSLLVNFLYTHMHNIPPKPGGDVEVHRGFDNRLYILDYARLCPPGT